MSEKISLDSSVIMAFRGRISCEKMGLNIRQSMVILDRISMELSVGEGPCGG